MASPRRSTASGRHSESACYFFAALIGGFLTFDRVRLGLAGGLGFLVARGSPERTASALG